MSWRTGLKSSVWVLAVGVVALVLCSGATARAAEIDPSFGNAGWSQVATAGLSGSGTDVEIGVGPEGTAFVADSGEAIAHFSSDGTPVTFPGGKVVLKPGLGSTSKTMTRTSFSPADIAVDGQGRLLVFGTEIDALKTFTVGLYNTPYLHKSSALVLRYAKSGHLDPSFGGGAGFVEGLFGQSSEFVGDVPFATAEGGTVDSDENPTFIVGSGASVDGCVGHSTVGYVPRAVVRLEPSGALDRGFGIGGIAPLGGSAPAPSLFVDSSGGAVADVGPTGNAKQRCQRGSTLVRFDPTGSRISSFGHRGSLRIEPFKVAFAEPDGSLLLERLVGASLELKRTGVVLGRGGLLDPDGLISIRPAAGPANLGAPIIVDGEGRIIYVGYRPGRKHSTIVVGRFLADGSPDESFGADGWLESFVPGGFRIASIAAKLDPEGRLLVAAGGESPRGGRSGYLLARYLLEP